MLLPPLFSIHHIRAEISGISQGLIAGFILPGGGAGQAGGPVGKTAGGYSEKIWEAGEGKMRGAYGKRVNFSSLSGEKSRQLKL
jgi:hypothetical protein